MNNIQYSWWFLWFPSRRSRRHFFQNKRLDDISLFQVLILVQSQAALVTRCDLLDIVFETSQRLDFTLVNDYIVPDQPGLAVALEHSGNDLTSGNNPDFRHGKHLPYLGPSHDFLAEGGLEQAFEAVVAVFDEEGLAALRTILSAIK